MNRAGGFTLMELVVVIVLAGILAALAIPRFTGTESSATWYSEQVKAAARYAQRQAVAQRRNVYVCIAATSVSLTYDAGCSTALTQPGTTAAYSLAAPSGVSLATTTFSFNSLGQPSSAQSLNIAGHTITVEAETGYVR
jgi:MSHA pilin protein MshC